MCDNQLTDMLLLSGSRHSTKPAWDCVSWPKLHPNIHSLVHANSLFAPKDRPLLLTKAELFASHLATRSDTEQVH